MEEMTRALEAREKIAAFLLARDETYSATPHLLSWAELLIQKHRSSEHTDCDNTCFRCLADEALADADKIIALAAQSAAPVGEPVCWQVDWGHGEFSYPKQKPNIVGGSSHGDVIVTALYAAPSPNAPEVREARRQGMDDAFNEVADYMQEQKLYAYAEHIRKRARAALSTDVKNQEQR